MSKADNCELYPGNGGYREYTDEQKLRWKWYNCPNIKETSSATDMDGETYECEKCNYRYRLYYDDMA